LLVGAFIAVLHCVDLEAHPLGRDILYHCRCVWCRGRRSA
jgi:hypothetical protein